MATHPKKALPYQFTSHDREPINPVGDLDEILQNPSAFFKKGFQSLLSLSHNFEYGQTPAKVVFVQRDVKKPSNYKPGIPDSVTILEQTYVSVLCHIPDQDAAFKEPNSVVNEDGGLNIGDISKMRNLQKYYMVTNAAAGFGGIFGIPDVGDWVLVDYHDRKLRNNGFIVKRLTGAGIAGAISDLFEHEEEKIRQKIETAGEIFEAVLCVAGVGDCDEKDEKVRQFIQDMKNSPLGGASNAFLAALASNAEHESLDFCAATLGDHGTALRNPSRAITKSACGQPEKSYCSFGYWQINICANSGYNNDEVRGAGKAFLGYCGTDQSELESSNETKEEVYSKITNPQEQFTFMNQYMSSTIPFNSYIRAPTFNGKSEKETARFYAQEVAQKFEVCATCDPSNDGNKKRASRAAEIMEKELYNSQ